MSLACPICGFTAADSSEKCPACGFHFAESTQQFEPVNISSENAAAAQQNKSQPKLRIIRGPRTGIDFTIEKQITSLGRSPHCDIFLNDMTVSREHALLAKTERGYVITDRNSFNGLWVNSKSCDSAILKQGDIIQLGKFCLVFEA